MAEVVGLIASLGAIAAASFKVAKAISTITDELGEAGAQINGIATDMRAVGLILHELKKRLEQSQRVTREVRSVAHEIVALCRADIEDIQGFLIPFMSPAGKDVGAKQKIKWLFAKAKVSSRRAALDSLKLTLNLFLHTLSFIESGEMDEYIEEEVDALILETQNTKTTLLNAEQADRKSKRVHRSNEGLLSAAVLQIEGGEFTSGGADAGDTASSQATTDDRSIDSDNDENKQMQLINHGSRAESMSSLESMSDDEFIQIAEHVRLQNLVRNFALRVMYPRVGNKSHDNSFGDEARGRSSHEWQDGYGGRYGHEIPRPNSAMSTRSDLDSELEKTKVELMECQGEIERLNEQLKAFQAERTKREETEKWSARERQIRKDAEEEFQQRMEAMRTAQKQVDKAKIEAENTARNRIHAERKAEEERARKHADAMREAEEKARLGFETELRAAEEARKREQEVEEAVKARIEAEQERKRWGKQVRKYFRVFKERDT
ncbi:hypothetical protein BGZ61DRAFT_452967 [Ilyonectria robusta]|uniref:uncharacterized protein n=1 Tax=Ilyonectria robusta TaxID=1079257 RepID=UPI001E8DF52C|nr:uncharacterized protein BGZ61DRAFT_452967 [Ilyonectria robusta]KAH8688244.1 hypothetical protein BGZ61DRAFT_452967 [Ilyonectria robusta]